MKILELTCHYHPNIGGVETHLLDLGKVLSKRGLKVIVLTYQPLTTKISWEMISKAVNMTVLRIPWIPGLFYRFVKQPILEFFYLFPGLFLTAPFVIFSTSPDRIHAHGLVAGTVAVIWGKIFGKRVVISTHSIYHFPKDGFYRQFVRFIFNRADLIMALSQKAVEEIIDLGIANNKVKQFTYWIDLNRFLKVPHAKEKLGWEKKFTILFVGRLILEKGVLKLLEASEKWNKNINLVVAGVGPLEDRVKRYTLNHPNIKYVGDLTQEILPIYYSGADLVIVPSVHEEGFGRVILEALASGTPVIGADIGAIPEAMDNSVGRLIKVSTEDIVSTVNDFYQDKNKLKKLAENTREFAKKRYSEKNAQVIIESLK